MIDFMSNIHIFISVHGAGMTNMFFMTANTVVVEIIPWPLCHCNSPDYFYGIGGYYHGRYGMGVGCLEIYYVLSYVLS